MAPPITSIGATLKWNAQVIVGADRISVNYGGLDVVSNDGNLAGDAEQKFPTIMRLGSVRYEGQFDPDDTQHQAVITDFLAKTARATVVTLADGTPTTLTASASHITAINGPELDKAGVMRWSFDITNTVAWVRA